MRAGMPTFGCAVSGVPPATELISWSAARAACGPIPQFAPIAATPRSRSSANAAAADQPASVSPSSSNVSWATIGSDETLCTASTAVTSSDTSKRLDHEEVDPTPGEETGLLGEEPERPLAARAALRIAERPDRAGHEHGRARHVARLARELHPRLEDRLEVVV